MTRTSISRQKSTIPNPNNQSLFARHVESHREKTNTDNQKRSPKKNWWTPIWRGLVADAEGKHRQRMGSALWLYLYLLAYSNRKTGIVRRTQASIAEDTGYPLRTIQFNLQKLRLQGYLTSERSGRYLKIQICRWKAFNHSAKKDAS